MRSLVKLKSYILLGEVIHLHMYLRKKTGLSKGFEFDNVYWGDGGLITLTGELPYSTKIIMMAAEKEETIIHKKINKMGHRFSRTSRSFLGGMVLCIPSIILAP